MQAVDRIQARRVIQIDRPIVVAAALMLAAAAVGAGAMLYEAGYFDNFPYLYLVPWLAVVTAVICAPSLYLYLRGRFSIAHPLVFATGTYFFPAFVVGGFLFVSGISEPYYISYIQDPRTDLPYTALLIAIGFAGLCAGYFLPIGSRLGNYVARWLPDGSYEPSHYLLPGVALLLLGIANSIIATAVGTLGYQHADQINSYDGLIVVSTFFWIEASFILWYALFSQSRWNLYSYLVIGLQIVTSISKALLNGNRGSGIQIVWVIGLAYILSGRRLGMRGIIITVVMVMLAVVGGMIYGTTFRQIKGTESSQSIGQYTDDIFGTFEQLGRTSDSLTTVALANIADRLDGFPCVAVVVSNYEKLAPYEVSYDIDNNILKDSLTFFVPRIFWPDKPLASDPRKYSALYFDYGESSFAITPIGDLVRNFGFWGVPLGMLLIGVLLRFLYSALMEGRSASMWKATLYFMLLTSVNYETFYGAIIPTLFKTGFTASIGLIFVTFVVRHLRGKRTAA